MSRRAVIAVLHHEHEVIVIQLDDIAPPKHSTDLAVKLVCTILCSDGRMLGCNELLDFRLLLGRHHSQQQLPQEAQATLQMCLCLVRHRLRFS